MYDRRVSRPSRPAYGVGNRRPPRPRRVVITAERAKLGFKVGLLVVAIWVVYNFFGVRSITVKGTKQVSPQVVVAAAQASLSRSFLGDNLLTLRPGQLSSDVMLTEYRLKSVTVLRSWPNKLTLVVTERQPSLNWQTNGLKYLLDADGSIIGPSQNGQLPVVIDDANLPVQKGDRVAPIRFVQFATQLAQEITPQTGLKIVQMDVPATIDELYVKTDKGYVVKFDTTRGAEEQLASLSKVLKTLAQLKKQPTEYIDLRVENKAYWR